MTGFGGMSRDTSNRGLLWLEEDPRSVGRILVAASFNRFNCQLSPEEKASSLNVMQIQDNITNVSLDSAPLSNAETCSFEVP